MPNVLRTKREPSGRIEICVIDPMQDNPVVIRLLACVSLDRDDYIDWLIEQLRWVVINDAQGNPEDSK